MAYKPSTRKTIPKQRPTPFDFVTCCGEPYDGYCCKRHHPDDRAVCCEQHDPSEKARRAKDMAKSAMGGRVGAGKGPAFSMGRPSKGAIRCTAIGAVPMQMADLICREVDAS